MTYEIEQDPILADQTPRTLARRVEEVLSTLQYARGVPCAECAGPLCGHETIMSMVLGYKKSPMCLGCLARAVGRDREHIGPELVAYILSKECLSVGWCWTRLREDSCSWSRGGPAWTKEPSAVTSASAPAPDAEWDAGDTACGDLVLELRMRLQSMRPGQVIKVTARDPGAPEDMPAWCHLTGHALLAADHPVYVIRKKEG